MIAQAKALWHRVVWTWRLIGNELCPKCGGGLGGVYYCDGVKPQEDQPMIFGMGPGGCRHPNHQGREHVVRVCSVCRYQSVREPLDGPRAKREAQLAELAAREIMGDAMRGHERTAAGDSRPGGNSGGSSGA